MAGGTSLGKHGKKTLSTIGSIVESLAGVTDGVWSDVSRWDLWLFVVMGTIKPCNIRSMTFRAV